jgi:hypothetical protein
MIYKKNSVLPVTLIAKIVTLLQDIVIIVPITEYLTTKTPKFVFVLKVLLNLKIPANLVIINANIAQKPPLIVSIVKETESHILII